MTGWSLGEHGLLEQLHVLLLGDVLGLAGGEVRLAQVRVPDAPVQAHQNLLALHRLVVHADRDDLGPQVGGLLGIALQLHAHHERGQRLHLLGGRDLLVVGAGHGRFEAVDARRPVKVQGRVHLHLHRALLVQLAGLGDGVGRAVGALARELRRAGEEKRLAPLGHVQVRPPRHRPGDGLTRDVAAGVVARDRLHLERRVEAHGGGPGQLHLERRNPVGLDLELPGGDDVVGLLLVERRGVHAGRRVRLFELTLKAGQGGEGERHVPGLAAGAGHHHRERLQL